RFVDLAATDHDLELVAQPGLLNGRDRLLHRIERQRQKAGQADDVRLELTNLVDEGLDRHINADVLDLETVDIEHEGDDILADIVQVTMHGADQDLSELFRLAAGTLLDQRLGNGPDILKHFAGEHKFGQEILAFLEALADDVHGVAAELQHPKRVGAFFEQHFFCKREGIVLIHVGKPRHQLFFLIGHFSHLNLPDQISASSRPSVHSAANFRFHDCFSQHVVVPITHQMNAGDAFDLTYRLHRFDQNCLDDQSTRMLNSLINLFILAPSEATSALVSAGLATLPSMPSCTKRCTVCGSREAFANSSYSF